MRSEDIGQISVEWGDTLLGGRSSMYGDTLRWPFTMFGLSPKGKLLNIIWKNRSGVLRLEIAQLINS